MQSSSRVLKFTQCPRCAERGKDSRKDNLAVYSDGSEHCFSCSFHKHPVGFRSPVKKEINDTKVLPYDYTSEVEPAGWKWLLQWGLPYSYWKPFVGYSRSFGRLVFKVGDTAFSIGRLVEPDKEGRKWYVWGDCHSHAELLGDKGSCTVLVEDIVSCHKVAQVEECMALFGTELHNAHIYALRDGTTRPIVLWLDDDQKGFVARKALRLQMLTNRPVTIVHTREDPKGLSIKEINETLCSTLGSS